jgi:uncharacterized protein YcbK (DUF882 family)
MKHFTIFEFACKCGCGYDAISPALVGKLELARDEAGVAFVITSGCRCDEHNKKVGGVAGSAHTMGLAADIAVTDKTKEVILKAVRKHFNRIGVAEKFIHVDIDESKAAAEWKY